MFKRTVQAIKKKIRDFLGVDTLERKVIQQEKEMVNNFSKHREWLNTHGLKISSLHDTLSNVVSMGSDITPYGRGNSWAVVCVEGQYNVVKFFDLSNRDGREMLQMLKAFEGSRYVNDTPHGFFPKDLFVNWDK